MPFQVRPSLPQDAPDVLRLSNLARGHQVTLEAFLEQEGKLEQAGEAERWRVVALQEGRTVGMAELRRFDYIPPGWLQLTLAVDEGERGQGIGAELLRQAEAQAAGAGAAGLSVSVLDHDPASRAWGERRGYALHAHRFANELDLSRAQQDPEWPDGVTLRDMIGAAPADWDRLEALYGDLLGHTPDLEGQPRWSPQKLRAHARDNPRLRPDWLLLAADPQGQWLGLCHGLPISTGIYNEFTGVVPAARGLGLARALKLELIRRAQSAGVTLMRTNNHSANAPMLAVNGRLGFERRAGSWELWPTQELRRTRP